MLGGSESVRALCVSQQEQQRPGWQNERERERPFSSYSTETTSPEESRGLFLPLELEGASIASNGEGAAGADESWPSNSAATLPRSTVASAEALLALGDESPESPEGLESDDDDDD